MRTNTLSERLKLAMSEPEKVSLTELARACGISQPSVSDWVSGKTKTIRGIYLLKAAQRLGVRAEWLASGKGHMRPEKSEEQVVMPDQFTIQQYDLRLAAGNGHMQWEITESEPYRIPRTVFERERVDPLNAKIVQVQGDSMAPWVGEGDVVMVDTSSGQRIRDGQPYAIAWDGEYYLKRVTRIPGGALQLTSDNPAYAPVIIPATEAPNVQVLGRVFWRGG